MKTFKPRKLGVLSQTFDSGDAYFSAISVLVLFPFAQGGSAERQPLLPEVDLWKLAAEELGGGVLDATMPKQRGEVLVTGSAFPPDDPKVACAPRVALGAIDKTVHASDPVPFTEMPIAYEKAGTYDDTWKRERWPGFPADMDWGIFNTAPEDQRIDGYFVGDEAFVVEHMHPDMPRIEARLPGVRARAFVTRTQQEGGDVFREVELRLDTVRLFPRAERGILIFHGMLQVAEDDGADVLHLVVGCEDLGDPKPVAHYEDVLARRLDDKRGHLLALADHELMPAPRGEAPVRPEDAAEKAAFASEGRLRRNLRTRLELARKQARARLIQAGLDPSQIDLPPLPPEEPPPDLDDPAFVERAMTEADAAREDAERKKAEADRHFRATCAARGLDPEEVLKDAGANAGGPPKFSADEEMARIRAISAQAKAQGMPIPEIDGPLADGSLEAGLRSAEQQAQEGYRRFAHHYPPAARLGEEQAARVRREVDEGYRAGESFAGRDLTGADLSGLHLAKADFRGAMLEGADLTGTELRGADLTNAILARANLTNASLFAAKLAGANLGSAKLAGALAHGADLGDAVLVGADLTGATLEDADLGRADLSEATLSGARLVRARAPDATFIKTNLASVTLAGADLQKCTFLHADVTGADFSAAKLCGAAFLATKGDGADFHDADLDNLRVVHGSSFEGATYRGARLDTANFRGTKLARSDFGGARLHDGDLSECDLRGASFVRADARGARFVRANLTSADMRSINLMEGSLAKAILHGADLSRSNLFRVDFARTRTDEATKLTDANVKRMRIVPPRPPPKIDRGPDAAR